MTTYMDTATITSMDMTTTTDMITITGMTTITVTATVTTTHIIIWVTFRRSLPALRCRKRCAGIS